PLFIQAASKLRPQNPTRARRAVAATAAISEAEATRRQMRILNVLGSILAARASVVFAAKGWEGSISGDYRYTASDLPSMLNDVRQMLASPPGNYRFVFDQAFVQRYLGGTALELANGIYFALQ
ncbi:MAG TPA: hypothetical protein VM555_12895, partial [Tahibacter sp.]|nr:hypothetical protein [Tahibacter sp.]